MAHIGSYSHILGKKAYYDKHKPVLLLHCDGTTASQTFKDSSPSNHTVTAVSDTAVRNTAPLKFNGHAYFQGTDDYLSIPDSANWNFGTGNLCIDFWVRTHIQVNDVGLLGQYDDDNNYFSLTMTDDGSDLTFSFHFSNAGSGSSLTTTAISNVANPWYHVAVIRGWGGNANDWSICVDGTSKVSGTKDYTLPDLDAILRVGSSYLVSESSYEYLNGYMDEIKIINGATPWIANFNVPPRPYTSWR